MLLRSFTKAILKNQQIWMLGIMQMLVWLFLIAFVFTQGATGTYDIILPATSTWYGYIALASFSTISVVLSATILYSNTSLAYCFRFTNLTPRSYMLDLLGACAILGAILSTIHMFATYLIFSYRFKMNLAPINPMMAISVSILAGVFMMGFGILLALISVNYTGLQSSAVLNFIPIMLTIVFGMSQIFTKLPYYVVLFSPFNAIESLLFVGYSNHVPHLQLGDQSTSTLPLYGLFATLLLWIVFLVLIDVFLLKRLKSRNIEEARPA